MLEKLKNIKEASNAKKIVGGAALAAFLYSSFKLYKSFYHVQPPTNYFLTEEQALSRRSQIAHKYVEYSVCLKLLPGDSYQGVISITFHAKYPLEDDIIIDYQGESIEEIIISGHKLKTHEKKKYSDLWDGSRLILPKASLTGGMNCINIFFKNRYSNTGTGLHSIIDSIDNRQYLFSQAEPDHMRQMIPCFDQPDIKGKFKLFLILPKEWLGVSNEILLKNDEFSKNNLKNEAKKYRLDFNDDFFTGLASSENLLWEFQTTQPISTYLFVVIAGPYCEYICENTYKSIPMSFYCKESLYKYLKTQAEDLLEITNLSMEFYEQFFQTPFPFSKYDQIFVSEFNGAMEHPGAVTIGDQFLFKDQINPEELAFRAIIISHELSHMWFGDLVTMVWWEDLWLNESFAEFFSHFCLSSIKMKKNLGDFNLAFFSQKGEAFYCDQLRTTHPVSGKIKNTEETRTVFDGITYCKGAAILKQIMFILGEEGFSRAIAQYFSKYKWDNAKLDDFFFFLQQEYENNLKHDKNFHLDEEWKSNWLNTAGLNECVAIWNEKNQSEQGVCAIKQNCALEEFPLLRNHKIKVVFFNENGDIVEIQEVFLHGEAVYVKYDPKAGFKAVLPNYEDHSYIKLVLNNESVSIFTKILKHIKHDLSRLMIWRAFYDLVRDGRLSSVEFTEIFENNIEYEGNEKLINDILTFAVNILSWTPRKHVFSLANRMFKKTSQLLHPKNTDSLNLTIKNSFVQMAYNEEDIHVLYQWLKGEGKNYLNDIKISIYEGWEIIKVIYYSKNYSLQEKQNLFDIQASRDPGDKNYYEKTIKGIIANDQEKKELWNYFVKSKNTDSLHLIRASMDGFNHKLVENQEKFHELYFKALIPIFKERKTEFSRAFAYHLFPNCDDLAYLKKQLEKILKKAHDRDIFLKKFVRERLDLNERKAKAHECFFKHIEKE